VITWATSHKADVGDETVLRSRFIISVVPHIVLHEAELPFVAIKINEHTKIIETGVITVTARRMG
jgi:hypothetical protein